MVALFEPETGETVSQDEELLLTVQLVLEVMANVFCSLKDEKLNELTDTVKMIPSCVTVIVCCVTPVPLTVRVAVRWDAVELMIAVTVMVPLFEPELGKTFSQDELLIAVQLVLDVMFTICCPPVFVNFKDAVETDSAGATPTCVTFIVR